MIQETIRKIEESLRSGDGAAPAQRHEALRLLAELKTELEALEATRGPDAQRIARLAESAHATARSASTPEARQDAVGRLTDSAREFEASHPKLTSVVDRIAEMLASAGL